MHLSYRNHNLSNKKKGYTFLELLIVMTITSILFVSFRDSFQIKNKDTLYGQACIETVYGQVNNFLHAGLSSKSLFSGTTAFFPDQYIITFNPGSGTIGLEYRDGITTGIYNSIDLSGNNNIIYCSSKTYKIVLTGEKYEIHINKGLQENTDLKFFYLLKGTDYIYTGENTFLQCNSQGTGCKSIARFESDTRTISIKKQICLSFTGDSDCMQWDN